MRRIETAIAFALTLYTCVGAVAEKTDPGSPRSLVTVVDTGNGSTQVVLESSQMVLAPNWSPDGSFLIVSRGNELLQIPLEGESEPRVIRTECNHRIGADHGISPDGKTLAFTAGPIWLLSVDRGTRRQATSASPCYFHGWSPDGKTLAYTANRGRGYENFTVEIPGGEERPLLTDAPPNSDSPNYSPDGAWVYYSMRQSKRSEIWRVKVAADPAARECVYRDQRDNHDPRPSPDGKWLIFRSAQKGDGKHRYQQDTTIRRIPLPGATVGPNPQKQVRELARFVGGPGSLGSRPWSPDGQKLVFVTHVPARPTIRVVLLTASDLEIPDGARQRLTRIADAADRFFFEEMEGWGYPPAVKTLFQRGADGQVEMLRVRGELPATSETHEEEDYHKQMIRQAARQSGLTVENHVWWVFIYRGDRPIRFNRWYGKGCARDGGKAIVNYDTITGRIRPDLGLDEGFNRQYFLKATVHELGHALGLPHQGPDLTLDRGNSLMGPNNDVYVRRGCPNQDRVYLNEASAAMLWKHPIFTGAGRAPILRPSVNLVEYDMALDQEDNRILISGRLLADQPAHSVVVVDDLAKEDQYWNQSYASRIAPDGSFKISIDRPGVGLGELRMMFCFENGMVTGDGVDVAFGYSGALPMQYRRPGFRIQMSYRAQKQDGMP